MICILCLPILVFADTAGLSTIEYDAVVINQNGTNIYDANNKVIGKIEYDSLIHIYNEYKLGDNIYGEVYEIKLDNGKTVSGTVLIKDILAKDGDYTKSCSETDTLSVLENGAYLYNGPSYGFGKVDENAIPIGTTLKGCQVDSQGMWSTAWYYVNYNGYNGYIKINEIKNGFIYGLSENMDYDGFITKSIPVYKTLEAKIEENIQGSKKIGTFKALDKVKVKYRVTITMPDYWFYVETDKLSGWIQVNDFSDMNLAIVQSVDVKTLVDTKLYAEPLTDLNQKVVATIPGNIELESDGVVFSRWGDYYHVRYKNYNGWIYQGFTYEEKDKLDYDMGYNTFKIKNVENHYHNLSIPDGTDKYDKINGNKTGVVDKDKKYDLVYYQLDIGTGKGWYHYVESDNCSNDFWVYQASTELYEIDDEITSTTKAIVSPTKKTDDDQIADKKQIFSLKEIIIYSIVGAVILSLLSIITMSFINNKRKEKELQNTITKLTLEEKEKIALTEMTEEEKENKKTNKKKGDKK